MKRKCCCCGKEIDACMGFVSAGDFLKAVAGEIPWKDVRELCGRCVFLAERVLFPLGK